MEFTIKKVDLLYCIDKCSQAVDSKHQLTAFRVMRVVTKKQDVKFCAVGEACSVDTVAAAEIKAAGEFNVSPQRLRDIAHVMPDGKIHISRKGTRVTVKSLTSKRKATFESTTVDAFKVDDPGSDAPWRSMKAEELLRALKIVKHASHSERQDIPSVSVLIPTEKGLRVFGCNGYLIAVADTSIHIDGSPIRVPEKAVELMRLMVIEDADIEMYSDQARLYLQNRDTLVSAALANTEFLTHALNYIALLEDQNNPAGPTFQIAKLHDGLKSVLALGGFAAENDRGSRGYSVKVDFKDTVVVELGFSEADARDEFDVEKTGAHISMMLSSKFFEQLLSSLSGYGEARVLTASDDTMLLIRTEGVTIGAMREAGKR